MLYPFVFEPIYKSTIWGGNRLSQFKQLPRPMFGVGESWELSQVEGDVSVLANGEMKGCTLADLLDRYPEEILGKQVYERSGKQFPLLFKFIDAKRDLSVQVHPDDEMARRHYGPQANGKTEMWYVVKAEPYAALIAGFTRNISTVEYQYLMRQQRIEEVLRRFKVQAGDVFYIPPGLVHSIGGGILLLEIQQSSDYTYRMYDYNRLDAHGKPRELHTELAAEALDYRFHSDVKKAYDFEKDYQADLVDGRYFRSALLRLQAGQTCLRNKKADDSFVVYNCLQGSVELSCLADAPENKLQISQGTTVLIPAALTESIHLQALQESLLMETSCVSI